FQRPHALDPPGKDLTPGVAVLLAFGLRGIGRRRGFLPGAAAVARAVHLDPEVSVVQGGVDRAVAPVGQHHGNVIAEERRPGDPPYGAVFAFEGEQSFARRREESCGHEDSSGGSLAATPRRNGWTGSLNRPRALASHRPRHPAAPGRKAECG